LSWLTTSPLRSLSLGAGLAAVIIAALLINPASEPKIAQVQPVQQAPVVTVPQLPEVAAPKNIAAAPKVIVAPKAATVKNTNLAAKTTTDKEMDEVLTSADSEGPVNYENLSESELESVVTIVQEMN
jgi:hypothetical protein